MQKVITAELQNHYHLNLEEPFKTFLADNWKVVSVSSAAARLTEQKAMCWVTVVMEK
jgi:hypothetical protein